MQLTIHSDLQCAKIKLMETTRKTLKTERKIELFIWPILFLISFSIIKLDILPKSSVALAGLYITGCFLLYYLTYALIPQQKHYLKNYTDPIILTLLILLTFQAKSYLSMIFLIPAAGSLLVMESANTLLLYLIASLAIAVEITIESIFGYKTYFSPELLQFTIAFALVYYLRLLSQKARYEKAMKEEEQRKLAETNRHLLEIENQGKEFTGLAAQQIFTPLATVQSFVQTLQSENDGKLSTRQKQFVNETSNYIEKMHKMLRELLLISKIEFSGYSLTIEPLDIVDVIRKSITKFEPILKEKSIEIAYKFPEEIPTVKGDEDNLTEIFERLIDNAIRYSPKQTAININIQIVQKEDAPHLIIEIKDHGCGIPLEEQKYLFRKFFRGTNILPFDNFGNGLSLFIVKLIMDKHSAQIRLKSALNNGTAIELDFRLQTNQTLAELRNKIPSSKIRANSTTSPEEKNRQISSEKLEV